MCRFFWKILDLEHKGYLTVFDLNYFFRDVCKKMVSSFLDIRMGVIIAVNKLLWVCREMCLCVRYYTCHISVHVANSFVLFAVICR